MAIEFEGNEFLCTGDNTGLCSLIQDQSFCNTYAYLTTNQCYWDNDESSATYDSCTGDTSCETYFDVFTTCPPPCTFQVDEAFETAGGRLRFRIFRESSYKLSRSRS